MITETGEFVCDLSKTAILKYLEENFSCKYISSQLICSEIEGQMVIACSNCECFENQKMHIVNEPLSVELSLTTMK